MEDQIMQYIKQFTSKKPHFNVDSSIHNITVYFDLELGHFCCVIFMKQLYRFQVDTTCFF
jgi:hypothetical protein